jgi:hypothetical protein
VAAAVGVAFATPRAARVGDGQDDAVRRASIQIAAALASVDYFAQSVAVPRVRPAPAPLERPGPEGPGGGQLSAVRREAVDSMFAALGRGGRAAHPIPGDLFATFKRSLDEEALVVLAGATRGS